MNVKFLGAAGTVTGSSTLLETGALKWLIDCGMFQGGRQIEKRNWNVAHHRPQEISFILLTHAHIDHSGLIPKLVKEGFQGKIICTKATRDLCEVMLRDSAHIQEAEAEWEARKGKRSGRGDAEPLFTLTDAEESLALFQPVSYGEVVPLAEGARVRFQDAGHILGSAILEMWVEQDGTEKKLVFSGDLGHSQQPFVRDPARIEEADVLWIESTYGDRLHKPWQETFDEFLDLVKDAVRHRSKVVIPAFAVERTQDLIYTLGGFIRKGLLPSIPIYVDSPLAISATEIFKRNADVFDLETRKILLEGENPLDLPEMVYAKTSDESKAINEDTRPGIIISASGMCDAGRIKHHLKHHLWRPESHIVFVGYQAQGTTGRRIVDGAKSVRLFGEEIAVRAQVHTLGGFSAHADQKELLEWVSHFKNPKLHIFVVHGEEKSSLALENAIRQKFPFSTSIPEWREQRRLFGFEEQAVPVQIREKKERREGVVPSEDETDLIRALERSFRKLRRKLKQRKRTRALQDPRWRKPLEEIHAKIEELDSKLGG